MATYKQILKDLQARKFAPIYLFMGEETYYIDKLTQYIADNALSEDERAFNQIVLYGEDTDAGTLDNTARRFPMMAQHQVVILKEAQNLKRIDDLVHYAQKPVASTILVLAHKYKSVAKNKKLYKAIESNGVVFESKKLYDNHLPDWISEYLHDKQFLAEPQAIAMLAENLGTDLSKLANELDKLCILLPQGSRITLTDVEKNIGINREFNNFELNKAIGQRNVLKANRIINYFAANQREHHIIATISALFSYFEKLLTYYSLPNKNDRIAVAQALKINPFFVQEYLQAARNYPLSKVKQCISYLREYDMKSKGFGNTSADAGDLLKELIFKIMH